MSRVQFEFDLNGAGHNNPPSASKAGTDLFVGLQPTEAAERQSLEIASDLMHRLDVTEAVRPLHVTLDGLGNRKEFSITGLAAKKEELSSIFIEPFMLTLDQIMSLGRLDGKKALVLCCGQPNPYLLELQQKIVEAQRQPGIEGKSARSFMPHMTLFYSHQIVLRQRLETPVRWLVRDFHIIWSHTGECRHESLWQWPPSA